MGEAAAFRRLCVETGTTNFNAIGADQPPSGGCVLKQQKKLKQLVLILSRLQAAVC